MEELERQHAEFPAKWSEADPVTPGLWESLGSSPQVATLILALCSAATWFVTSWVERRRAAKEHDLLERGPTIPPNERRSSFILLGVGAAGKSTLLRQVSGADQPERATLGPNPVLFSRQFPDTKTPGRPDITCNYCGLDYEGQNIAVLVAHIIAEQGVRGSLLHRRSISGLVFVLDPVPYDGSVASSRVSKSACLERIDEQVREWSDTALDACFGLALQESLCSVTVFINKMDACPLSNSAVLEAFNPLLSRIEARARGATFTVLTGSARTGEAVSELVDLLTEYALPHGSAEEK